MFALDARLSRLILGMQDAYDVFTGSWVPRNGPALAHSLLIDDRPLHVRSVSTDDMA